ncbi:hypothetical protein LWI29_021187 [Acer saccharum]|uniref:F-box/kelch-repeat protein n=1 Tax=Acer saccharum TaxID=4024 RepID=A0AA39VTH5_ACESA|nr:hypothetical protein LWI29_021187 [Acer saccharum]
MPLAVSLRHVSPYNKLHVFDLGTLTWSMADATGDVPPPRVGVTMAAVGNTICVWWQGWLNDLWAFDLVDQKWIEYPIAGDSCKGRGGPRLVVARGKIWVVYGFAGVEMDDVHCFDPVQGKWAQVETSGEKPTARSVFSTVEIGKFIIVYGEEVDLVT